MNLPRNATRSSARRALAIPCALILGLASQPGPAYGQVADDAEAELDRMQVTGSRITRADSDQANPVQIITRQEIDERGVASVAELLQLLPVAGASLNQLGSAGTSFGAANINLRNLGANRTLVLVNGRRLVNTGGGRGFRDFVDLNSIPLAAVERVEILKDGASAIYGSDAIAGVVNVITRQNFDGGNLSVQYGETTEGDGEQISADLSFGMVGERGSFLLTASHVDNDPIFVDDRSFSRMPLGTLSLNSPFGRFAIPGLGTLTLIEGRPGTSPDDFRPFSNANDRVNLFENTFLTQPNKRDSIFGQVQISSGRKCGRNFGSFIHPQKVRAELFTGCADAARDRWVLHPRRPSIQPFRHRSRRPGLPDQLPVSRQYPAAQPATG